MWAAGIDFGVGVGRRTTIWGRWEMGVGWLIFAFIILTSEMFHSLGVGMLFDFGYTVYEVHSGSYYGGNGAFLKE